MKGNPLQLLNVSIGTIHAVQIGSEVVKTGFLKRPAPQPWVIDDQGVIGDRRAVHPDKIYAFARDAYAYWGEHLNVDAAKWPDGFFGENLTLDTLDEDEVRIGDVFALGNDVRLFVAGARNPCHKLAWRLNQPLTFQKTFARSRRSGMYLGILSGGVVQPGDALDCLERDAAMPSVAAVSNMIAEKDPPDLAELCKLLDYSGLSPGNRIFLSAKRDASERAEHARAGDWEGWRDFVVDHIADEALDIRSVYFRSADGKELCGFQPGQFVTVELPGEDGVISRCWSLSSFSDNPRQYRLTVRQQQGRGSRRFHALQPGARVRLRAPAGRFTLNRGSFRPTILIAAGIGITPLRSMLDAQLSRPDTPPVYLFYGGRTPESLAFRAELEALAELHPRFRLITTYTGARVAGALTGRISSDMVIAELADLQIEVNGNAHKVPWFETEMYLCGPKDFCVSLEAALIQRGANPDRIFLESFSAINAEDSEARVEEAEVRFIRSGVAAQWTSKEGQSLLELAEAVGIAVPNDCRAGSCLTCRSKLLRGSASVDAGEQTTLPCIARPTSLVLEMDL